MMMDCHCFSFDDLFHCQYVLKESRKHASRKEKPTFIAASKREGRPTSASGTEISEIEASMVFFFFFFLCFYLIVKRIVLSISNKSLMRDALMLEHLKVVGQQALNM